LYRSEKKEKNEGGAQKKKSRRKLSQEMGGKNLGGKDKKHRNGAERVVKRLKGQGQGNKKGEARKLDDVLRNLTEGVKVDDRTLNRVLPYDLGKEKEKLPIEYQESPTKKWGSQDEEL